MHNFMRFIRQNRKQIIKVALIVAFLIALIQLLNYLAGQNTEVNSSKKSDSIYEESNGTIISDKSAVSGGSISINEIKNVNKKIEEFVKYCNDGKKEEAYSLLSDTCKEKNYPSIESFITYYYEPLFKEKRTYKRNYINNESFISILLYRIL